MVSCLLLELKHLNDSPMYNLNCFFLFLIQPELSKSTSNLAEKTLYIHFALWHNRGGNARALLTDSQSKFALNQLSIKVWRIRSARWLFALRLYKQGNNYNKSGFSMLKMILFVNSCSLPVNNSSSGSGEMLGTGVSTCSSHEIRGRKGCLQAHWVNHTNFIQEHITNMS